MTNEQQDALMAIAASGDLTPDRLVTEAADEASPLHSLFEWDDAKAAHSHRVATARAVIRAVKIEVIVQQRRVVAPCYVHDPERDKDGGYIRTVTLASDRDQAVRVLHQEMERIAGAVRRIRAIAATCGMEDAAEVQLGALLGAPVAESVAEAAE